NLGLIATCRQQRAIGRKRQGIWAPFYRDFEPYLPSGRFPEEEGGLIRVLHTAPEEFPPPEERQGCPIRREVPGPNETIRQWNRTEGLPFDTLTPTQVKLRVDYQERRVRRDGKFPVGGILQVGSMAFAPRFHVPELERARLAPGLMNGHARHDCFPIP